MEEKYEFDYKPAFIALAIVLAIALLLWTIRIKYWVKDEVSNFEECLEKGFRVMESYPRRCRASDGQVFIEVIDIDLNGGTSKCIITGCSGQICSDEEIITTCEFLPKYVCFKNATCEHQPSGECGWTMTEKLQQCLDTFKDI